MAGWQASWQAAASAEGAKKVAVGGAFGEPALVCAGGGTVGTERQDKRCLMPCVRCASRGAPLA